MAKHISVLSIDGGGIFGIISALILSEIENQTKKPISSLFDLISGTSTGGIIALGLTTPNQNNTPKYSAQETADFYEFQGSRVFSSSFFHKIVSLFGLIDEKYPPKGAINAFQEFFGSTLLSEALTPLLIPSYDLQLRNAYFFKSVKANFDQDREFYFKDIARATSAAPSYFEPAHVKNLSNTQSFTFVDGGIFADNPALCAYTEARTIFPDSDIALVSIGVNWPRKSYPFKSVKNRGIIGWTLPLIDSFFDGQEDVVDYELKNLFPQTQGEKNMYFRVDVPVGNNPNNTVFDKTTPEFIKALKGFAKEYISNNKTFISEICQTIT